MKNKSGITLLITIMFLAGCSQPEDLETSVNNRWQALIDQDLEKAYDYFSPGYKNTESLESFKLRMATAQLHIKWTAGEYKNAECASAEVCDVNVSVVYSYSFPKKSLGGVDNVPTMVKEQWIKVDDNWQHVPKNN